MDWNMIYLAVSLAVLIIYWCIIGAILKRLRRCAEALERIERADGEQRKAIFDAINSLRKALREE